MKFSRYEYILVIFIKLDKVVTFIASFDSISIKVND